MRASIVASRPSFHCRRCTCQVPRAIRTAKAARPRSATSQGKRPDAGGDAEALYEGLAGLVEVFGTDLADNQAFGETVATHLDSLLEIGVKATVAELVG